MPIVFIIAIAQALFFCFFLITKKGSKILRGLLVLWLILISFSLFLNYLYETEKIKQLPHFIGLDTAFPFLYLPILYVYSQFLVAKKSCLEFKDIIHTIPFIAYLIYVFIFFYFESPQYKLEFLYKLFRGQVPLDIQISNFIKIIQAFIYFILIFRVIHRYQHTIKLNFSYTESINLKWLKIVTICLSIIYLLKFLGVISIYIQVDSFLERFESMSDLAVIMFVYIIAFYGIKQPDIFAKWNDTSGTDNFVGINEAPIEYTIDKDPTKSKYQKSTLSKEESEQILDSLNHYMTEQKPYLQSQLTIKDVAQSLNINSKYLSQVINQQFGFNFFNYINEYRVNEVKSRIADPKYGHFTILGIGLECGFNSKSSFNSVFKKVTGQTPTAYKSEKYGV